MYAGRTWLVAASEAIIGRSRASDVVLGHDSVSGRHARVTHASDGFHIEDLDSSNGTFVNGERIGRATPIAAGDRLTIGTVDLVADLVRAKDVAAPPEPDERLETIVVGFDTDIPTSTQMYEVEPPEEETPETDQEVQPEDVEVSPEADEEAPLQPVEVAVAALSVSGLRAWTDALLQAQADFEAAGGRTAALEVIQQAERVTVNPLDVRELVLLAQLASVTQRLLEGQLRLVDLLWPPSPEEDTDAASS